MTGSIGHFRDEYAERFAGGARTFLTLHGKGLIRQIQEVAVRPRRTVYILGNGGSHSISRCMEYALRTYAVSQGLTLRTQTGVDVHQLSLLSRDGSPGMPFAKVLETEGADSSDLLILVSGGGDSDNLCDAAVYAEARSIPTFGLLGSSRGKLKNFLAPARCFFAPVEDQQISEDIIQSLAYFLSYPVAELRAEEWGGVVSREVAKVKRAVQRLPKAYISAVVEAVVAAFRGGRMVRVIGLDHPTLSVCAEHTAHNLYWDSIYQIEDPPDRLIWSSPTGCNFSGISNDRRREVIASLMGVGGSGDGGVALLYSMSAGRPAVGELLARLSSLRNPTFLLSAGGELPPGCDGVALHDTGLKEPQLQAGVAQILGHIVGRLIRMRLMETQRAETLQPISDPARFLADFDLAQRRLLDD